MAMYENDEIDITGVSLFDLERVLDPDEPLNKELVIAPPDFSISYIGFNTSMPPFDDTKFRQALNHAVDKELIAREVLSDLPLRKLEVNWHIRTISLCWEKRLEKRDSSPKDCRWLRRR